MPNTIETKENATGILLGIAAHLATQREIQLALNAVTSDIARLIPYAHVDICLHDTPGWTVTYEAGIRTSWSRRRTRLKVSPVRSVLNGDVDHMLTDNAMEDIRYVYPGATAEPIIQHGLRARVNVPMRVMDQIIGSLNISHTKAGIYDDSTVALTHELACVLAPWFKALHAAERIRQATRGRTEAQDREEGLRRDALDLTQALEQERQRIGMDLHDQTLADLSRLLRDVTSEGPLPARDVLASRLTEAIGELRQIIDTAVPTLLDMFGFADAIGAHLERALGDAPVTSELRDNSNGAVDRLDTTTRIALFRIAQEAVNNAVRHSGADWIAVSIDIDAGSVLVTIRDNGRGLGDPGQRPISGIAHMKTRARLIGADLQLFDDSGTCVAVYVPVGPEEAT